MIYIDLQRFTDLSRFTDLPRLYYTIDLQDLWSMPRLKRGL